MGGETAARAELRVGHALGGVRGHELGDVLGLPEHDVFVGALNLHAQEVRDFALVLHVPSIIQSINEGGIKGMFVIMGVHDEQVVHIASDEQLLVSRALRSID